MPDKMLRIHHRHCHLKNHNCLLKNCDSHFSKSFYFTVFISYTDIDIICRYAAMAMCCGLVECSIHVVVGLTYMTLHSSVAATGI